MAVKQFISEHINRLTVYKLPPYSPDYNPIEKVWKRIKTSAIHLHYFPAYEQLKDKVNQALSYFSNQGQKLLSVFKFYGQMEQV